MFTLPGMSDIYQGGKALYLSAVTQTNNGQHINSFAQNSSLMTTIIVSYNLKWFLSKSETFCLVEAFGVMGVVYVPSRPYAFYLLLSSFKLELFPLIILNLIK